MVAMCDADSLPALAELERAAWVAGDYCTADILGRLVDAVEAAEQEPERVEAAEKEAFDAGKEEGRTELAGELREQCEALIGELLDHGQPLRKPRRLELAAKLAEILL